MEIWVDSNLYLQYFQESHSQRRPLTFLTQTEQLTKGRPEELGLTPTPSPSDSWETEPQSALTVIQENY